MSVRAWVIAVASGLLVGSVLTLFIVRGWDVGADVPHEEAAERFLVAWERSLTEDLVVLSDFHRVTTRGGALDSVAELAQRPPDRLVWQHGGVAGRLGDEVVACSPGPAGDVVCGGTTPVAESYAAGVERELAEWRTYLDADPHPLYRVSVTDDGCFELRLTRADALPPYGNLATFCFDTASGARRFERIERDEGVDVTEAVEIRTDVRDEDFELAGA